MLVLGVRKHQKQNYVRAAGSRNISHGNIRTPNQLSNPCERPSSEDDTPELRLTIVSDTKTCNMRAEPRWWPLKDEMQSKVKYELSQPQ
jgi:hypothetical protein